MKKRIFSALLSLALVFSLIPSALAASPVSQTEILQALAALDILVGDESGNLNLASPVTRAEFTKLVVTASPYRDNVGEASVSPYPDVPRTHWAAGYVQAAVSAGMITGYLDGTFRPSNSITLAEGVTMVLRLLGYQNSDFSGAYPSGQMALYRALDLDVGVSASSNNDPLTRQDCMYLFYNLLTARTKTGQPYLTSLGFSLTPSGEVDLVALINAAMDGPVVASGSWQSELGFNLSSATVYRSGALSSLSAIQENDVVYWSKSMRTLWVYANRVSGTITGLTPSASAPTGVTVGGKTYSIETSSAAYALSDLGGLRVGDTVTLLLGRDGGVAAVLSGSSSSGVGTVYGLVTQTATDSYQDADGNSYTANTVTLIATDGSAYSYRCDSSSIHPGDLVQVTVSGGQADLKRLSGSSLSGSVNAAGTELGGYPFADDVQILDTYEQSAVRVYPSRLAGMELTSSMVRFYQLNPNGEISRLILSDATGDMHTYGVITESTEFSSGAVTSTTGIYAYDAAGVAGVVQGSKIYSVDKGPMVIKWKDGSADRIANLTGVKLDSAAGTTAQAGSRSYTISDSVVVYELRDGDYFLSSLNLVNGSSYTLTGYYDKDERDGGRIRVIVAKAS